MFTHREEVVAALGCIHGLVGGTEEHGDTGGGAGMNADSRSGSDFYAFNIRGELLESSMEGLFHAGECAFFTYATLRIQQRAVALYRPATQRLRRYA